MIGFICFLCLGVLVLVDAWLFAYGLSNIARGRKYKSGTRWCFWRWTDVDSEYILRLHIFKSPWFAVCLHWINKPDAEPWLHDHPVSFLSLILRGGYTEMRYRGRADGLPLLGTRVEHRWFNFVRARFDDMHRIVRVWPHTLTLCFMGPVKRMWGFHVCDELDETGWIFWKDYYARLRAGEDMRSTVVQRFMRKLDAVYTPERTAAAAGAPPGRVIDEDARAIDVQPFDSTFDDDITMEYER